MTIVLLVARFMCLYFNNPRLKFIANNSITSHAQDTTALQSNISLNGIQCLMVTDWEPVFPSAENYKCQQKITRCQLEGSM